MSEIKRFIDFSKPFIDATRNVFETMIFTKIQTGKPAIKDGNTSKGDVSAVLGLSGEYTKDGEVCPYRAMLVISFPFDTYIKAASAMLMEEYTEYNDEISDVAGEICNMVMGNAKRDLTALGYTTNMAIPSIVMGKNHSIRYPGDTIIIMIPISSAHGDFYIELCYKDNVKSDIEVKIQK